MEDPIKLVQKFTASHPGVAIRVCTRDGDALATFCDGIEVDDREAVLPMQILEPGTKITFNDARPEFFVAGQWDNDLEKFVVDPQTDTLRPLHDLLSWAS